MGYSAAVKARNNTNKNVPVGTPKLARTNTASPMGKLVQVKGVKTSGSKAHLGKRTPANVKASTMSNKLAVVDMPKKSVNGRSTGKNNLPLPKGKMANVMRANPA